MAGQARTKVIRSKEIRILNPVPYTLYPNTKECCISADGSKANCCDPNACEDCNYTTGACESRCPDCQTCDGAGNCRDCDPDETCCDGECFDPTAESVWQTFYIEDYSVIVPCYAALCDGDDGVNFTEACGNSVSISCSQSDGSGGVDGCALRIFYNGALISSCIWETGAQNSWQYKKISSGGKEKITKIIHVTQDTDCDESCSGKSCALVTVYDCVTGSKNIYWRRVDGSGGDPASYIYDETDGEECPGHPDKI